MIKIIESRTSIRAKMIGMQRRGLVLLPFALVASLASQAEAETLVDGMRRRVASLPTNERLLTVRLAENEAVTLYRDFLASPEAAAMSSNNRIRVGVIIFGSISLVLAPEHPDIAKLYEQRTELLADVIRDRETAATVSPLETRLQNEINELMERRYLVMSLTTPIRETRKPEVLSNGKTLGRDLYSSALRQVRDRPMR